MFSYAFLRSTYHMIPSLFASERWGAAQVALRTHDTTAVFAKRMATSTWDAVRMHPPSCINLCIVRDCITCMGTLLPAAKDNFLTLKSNASHTRTHARTHIHTHHYLRRIWHWSFHPVCQWFWKIISVFVVTIFFKPLMLELFFSRCNSQISCWRQLKKHPAQHHYLVSLSVITFSYCYAVCAEDTPTVYILSCVAFQLMDGFVSFLQASLQHALAEVAAWEEAVWLREISAKSKSYIFTQGSVPIPGQHLQRTSSTMLPPASATAVPEWIEQQLQVGR